MRIVELKIVKLKDIVTADDRTFYVVGEADDLDGDSADYLQIQ